MEYNFLSNKSRYGFVVDGKMWPTADHFIYASMFRGTEFEEQLRKTKSIQTLYKMCKGHYKSCIKDERIYKRKVYGPNSESPSDDWSEVMQKAIIEKAIRCKFEQNKHLIPKLILIEGKIVNKSCPLSSRVLNILKNYYTSIHVKNLGQNDDSEEMVSDTKRVVEQNEIESVEVIDFRKGNVIFVQSIKSGEIPHNSNVCVLTNSIYSMENDKSDNPINNLFEEYKIESIYNRQSNGGDRKVGTVIVSNGERKVSRVSLISQYSYGPPQRHYDTKAFRLKWFKSCLAKMVKMENLIFFGFQLPSSKYVEFIKDLSAQCEIGVVIVGSCSDALVFKDVIKDMHLGQDIESFMIKYWYSLPENDRKENFKKFKSLDSDGKSDFINDLLIADSSNSNDNLSFREILTSGENAISSIGENAIPLMDHCKGIGGNINSLFKSSNGALNSNVVNKIYNGMQTGGLDPISDTEKSIFKSPKISIPQGYKLVPDT